VSAGAGISPGAMPEPTVEEVATAEGLDALVPAWTELWKRAPAATPFQSPAWLVPWWRHFGEGELVVLCTREGAELLGLLPLYIYDEPPLRKLLPVGIGNSDWLDAICAPGREHEVARVLLEAIAGRAGSFDVCDLQPLPADSFLLQADAPGLLDERITLEPCPILRLPEAVAGLETTLPKAMRQNLRYYRRRAERHGRLRFETAGPASLHELLEAFYALHGARWQRQGLPGVLADGPVRAFHSEAAPALMEQDALRLHALRLDERIVAGLYGFTAKGRFYHYLAGFDPDLRGLGLGTLVIGHAMEQAVREGAWEFDFLRGGEAYKYRWGARDRPSYGRRLRACG
jgi:CelD/BcsL family acetyltransferase involved in cellulose biosynthesis